MGKTKRDREKVAGAAAGARAGGNCGTPAAAAGLSPCTWLAAVPGGVVVSIHVQPGARRTASAGIYDGRLKVALAAPPVDGRANAALQEFLAREAGVAKSAVSLLSGQTSRSKRFLVRGAGLEELRAALDPGN